MTNEAIKALMLLALYGVLEIALFSSPILGFAKRKMPSGNRRARVVYNGSSSSVDGST